MTIQIPKEYDDGYDFGFTAVDSEETVIEKPVVNTEPINQNLSSLDDKVSDILSKIDALEEIIKASAGAGKEFDIDAYRQLVEKDVKEKLIKLEGLILPLLINLKKNPDKDIIKWPNRVPVIDSQIQKILAITRAT